MKMTAKEMKEMKGKMPMKDKKGMTVAVMVALPKRGQRTAKNKAKK
jgi:hypothetical protein